MTIPKKYAVDIPQRFSPVLDESESESTGKTWFGINIIPHNRGTWFSLTDVLRAFDQYEEKLTRNIDREYRWIDRFEKAESELTAEQDKIKDAIAWLEDAAHPNQTAHNRGIYLNLALNTLKGLTHNGGKK